MANKLIWNDSKTMNFLASEYLATRIIYPSVPAHEGRHSVIVHLKGSTLKGASDYSGLKYATCRSEKEAKKCLVKLTDKLVRAGVIEVTETEGSNRFDHVDLQEVRHE